MRARLSSCKPRIVLGLFADWAIRVAVARVAILAVLSLSACRSGDKPAPNEPPSPTLARGDHVVVELSAADFFEARVTEVLGAELRVEALGDKRSHVVAASDVYRLPARRSSFTATTGPAICRVGAARWVGCRVERTSADGVHVSDTRGRSFVLGGSEILEPTPVTALNLRHAFEQSARRAEFERAVARAGRPRAPTAWRPSPRERVLAKMGGAWYPARVHEIEDERLHVAFKSDDRVTELPREDVVPEPPHGRRLERGAIVLVRPETEAGAWVARRVQATGPEIVVEDADGERRSVNESDVLPLVQ